MLTAKSVSNSFFTKHHQQFSLGLGFFFLLFFGQSCFISAQESPESAFSSAIQAKRKPSVTLPKATEYNPEKVVALLSLYHGVSKNQLDAASTEVPSILRQVIEEGTRNNVVLSNAVDALGLYPSETTLNFVLSRFPQVRQAEKSSYLSVGAKHKETQYREKVLELMRMGFQSSDFTLRYRTAELLKRVSYTPDLLNMVQKQIKTENNAQVLGVLRKTEAHHNEKK